MLAEYDHIIQHQRQAGIVEIVENPAHQDGNRVYYLPHHAVIRIDKETSKVRIVYDASASENGPSLNTCLHTGPKFNQRTFDILLRFRMHKVDLGCVYTNPFILNRHNISLSVFCVYTNTLFYNVHMTSCYKSHGLFSFAT